MTRVAFFIRSMNGGGAQRAMVRLASGFAEAGYDVEVLTLQPAGNFRDELSPKVTLTKLGPERISGAVLALARYLRKRKPAALLVTEPASNIAVVLAKVVSRSHSRILIREGLFPSVAVRESPHQSTRFAYRLAPVLYRRADVIVSIATEMTEDLVRFARLAPGRVITVPVNPVVTPALEEAAAAAPSHAWFDDSLPIVLGVGRLDRQKDFATLLDAFEQVRTERACRLLILGDGPLRADLEKQRASSAYASEIALSGFDPNPFASMSRCRAFVLSSRYEGQPNVLIEALACGAPVVATDCPSGPRDILDGGRFGRLVPVGDSGAMANAIRATLDSPVDRDLSRARGAEFTLSNSTALYIQALFQGASTS
jgi:glycosyltransferase involved in cell wall biosynthesis